MNPVFHWLYEMTWGAHQPIPVNNLSNDTIFLELGILGGLYKRFNCTESGCWRIGWHKVAGTKYRTCHPHLTNEVHSRLHADHARKHPEQHAVLNRGADG